MPTETNQSQQESTETTQQQTTTTSSTSSETDLGGSAQTSQTETPAGETDLGASPEETPEQKAAREAAEAAAKPGAAFQGAPEGETPYGEFTMPDGYAADQELSALVTPLGKELNLNQAGMQKLVDLKPKMDQIALERWQTHLKALKTEAQADPDIGGAKYAPAIVAGKAVIAKFGSPNFIKMLNHYGVGAHPEMIKFMSKIAAATGETPTPTSEGGGTASVEKPLHELMYADERK